MVFCISSRGFNERDLEKFISEVKIPRIEVSSPFNSHPDYFHYMKKFYLLHNYFFEDGSHLILNLAAQDPEIQYKTFEYLKRGISLSKTLFSFHSGFAGDMNFVSRNSYFGYHKSHLSLEEHRKILVNNVKKLLPFAKGFGVRLALENNFPNDFVNNLSLLSLYDDFLEISNDIPDENFGFLLDVGHLKVAAHYLSVDYSDQLNKILALKDRIFEIHLSDNNGKYDQHEVPSMNNFQVNFICQNFEENIPVVLEPQKISVDEGIELYRRFSKIF